LIRSSAGLHQPASGCRFRLTSIRMLGLTHWMLASRVLVHMPKGFKNFRTIILKPKVVTREMDSEKSCSQ
jgi:hypothetical protein